MGLFSRKRVADGFYTGDAPVSAPGVDGAAPTAYLASDPATLAAPATAAAPTPTAPPVAPPVFPSTAGLPGGTGARPAPTARRRSGVGRLVAVSVVLLVVAAAVVVAVGQADSGGDAASSAAAPASPPSVGIGEPVTVHYGGATLELTVLDATAQPGGAWTDASTSDQPHLVVQVRIRRTDSGAHPITVMGWDWSITPASGRAVTGDIITGYQPDLTDPDLAAGDSARGYLSFRTPATAGTLAFSEFGGQTSLATWDVAAARPRVVTGSLGRPAQARISRPSFTVTVSHPRRIGPKNPAVVDPPRSGHYLVLTVRITPAAGVTGYLGSVSSESFVFRSGRGKPAPSVTFGVRDALFLETVTPGSPLTALLAFDTDATSGTLAMVDGAGRTVITWPLAAG